MYSSITQKSSFKVLHKNSSKNYVHKRRILNLLLWFPFMITSPWSFNFTKTGASGSHLKPQGEPFFSQLTKQTFAKMRKSRRLLWDEGDRWRRQEINNKRFGFGHCEIHSPWQGLNLLGQSRFWCWPKHPGTVFRNHRESGHHHHPAGLAFHRACGPEILRLVIKFH